MRTLDHHLSKQGFVYTLSLKHKEDHNNEGIGYSLVLKAEFLPRQHRSHAIRNAAKHEIPETNDAKVK